MKRCQRCLIIWEFEDRLKLLVAEFAQALVALSRDPLKHLRREGNINAQFFLFKMFSHVATFNGALCITSRIARSSSQNNLCFTNLSMS